MFGKDAGEQLLKYRNAEPLLFSPPVSYVLGTVIGFPMLLVTSWCLQIAVFSTQNLRFTSTSFLDVICLPIVTLLALCYLFLEGLRSCIVIALP